MSSLPAARYRHIKECRSELLIRPVSLTGGFYHAIEQDGDGQQVRQLCSFRKVTVLLDGDKPGREGARNLVERLVAAEVESVEMPMLAEAMQRDSVSITTLRICLGIPKEPDGPHTITSKALSLLESGALA